MARALQHIYLESYDFNKKKFLAVEYSWKAVFRIIPSSRDLPDLLFVAVSDNYKHTDKLQIGIVQEVLDIKLVVELIESRFEKYVDSGRGRELLDSLFIVDE